MLHGVTGRWAAAVVEANDAKELDNVSDRSFQQRRQYTEDDDDDDHEYDDERGVIELLNPNVTMVCEPLQILSFLAYLTSGWATHF